MTLIETAHNPGVPSLDDDERPVHHVEPPAEPYAAEVRSPARAIPELRNAIPLPSTTLVMVLRPVQLYGLGRLRGEVLEGADDRKVDTLESVGSVRRVPYGAQLLWCGCGRCWVNAPARESHLCELEDLTDAPPFKSPEPAANGAIWQPAAVATEPEPEPAPETAPVPTADAKALPAHIQAANARRLPAGSVPAK